MHQTRIDAALSDVETIRIPVERTFANFQEFWDIAFLAPPVGAVLSPLGPEITHQVKAMTQEFLGVDEKEHVTINGFANAVKGNL